MLRKFIMVIKCSTAPDSFSGCEAVDTKSLQVCNFTCKLFNFAGTRISENEIFPQLFLKKNNQMLFKFLGLTDNELDY